MPNDVSLEALFASVTVADGEGRERPVRPFAIVCEHAKVSRARAGRERLGVDQGVLEHRRLRASSGPARYRVNVAVIVVGAGRRGRRRRVASTCSSTTRRATPTTTRPSLVMHADVGKWVALGGEAYHLAEACRRLQALGSERRPAPARRRCWRQRPPARVCSTASPTCCRIAASWRSATRTVGGRGAAIGAGADDGGHGGDAPSARPRRAARTGAQAVVMATNFDLAPPPVSFDGKTAVPIDISTIDARLTFDGAASTASGDATLTFVVGPAAGRPMFDLRQTITGVWLDGAPLAVGQVLTRDLGGGPGAELRVLDVSLAAGVEPHAAPHVQPRAAGLARRRQLSAGPRLVGRPAARVQLRLHRSRRGALSRGLGAGQSDLGSVRRQPRAAGHGHGRSRTG